KHAAGFRVEGESIARRLSDVHDTVDDEWSRFEFFQRFRLKYPLLLEVLHICRIDLTERAIALACICSGIRQPVVRLVGSAQQALIPNFRGHKGNAHTKKKGTHLDTA